MPNFELPASSYLAPLMLQSPRQSRACSMRCNTASYSTTTMALEDRQIYWRISPFSKSSWTKARLPVKADLCVLLEISSDTIPRSETTISFSRLFLQRQHRLLSLWVRILGPYMSPWSFVLSCSWVIGITLTTVTTEDTLQEWASRPHNRTGSATHPSPPRTYRKGDNTPPFPSTSKHALISLDYFMHLLGLTAYPLRSNSKLSSQAPSLQRQEAGEFTPAPEIEDRDSKIGVLELTGIWRELEEENVNLISHRCGINGLQTRGDPPEWRQANDITPLLYVTLKNSLAISSDIASHRQSLLITQPIRTSSAGRRH